MEGTCGGDLWLDQVLGSSDLIKPFIFPNSREQHPHRAPLQPRAHQCYMLMTPGASTPGHESKDSGTNLCQTEALPLPVLADGWQLLALAQRL